jgi:hypothetical protein
MFHNDMSMDFPSPELRVHLAADLSDPLLRRLDAFGSGKLQRQAVVKGIQGAKTIRAFCIALLWAKFRSQQKHLGPAWSRLAEGAPRKSWAATLVENLSEDKDPVWWNRLRKGLEITDAPFRLIESHGKFSISYISESEDGDGSWAIARLRIFKDGTPITGTSLGDLAKELETVEQSWINHVFETTDEIGVDAARSLNRAASTSTLEDGTVDRFAGIAGRERRRLKNGRHTADSVAVKRKGASGMADQTVRPNADDGRWTVNLGFGYALFVNCSGSKRLTPTHYAQVAQLLAEPSSELGLDVSVPDLSHYSTERSLAIGKELGAQLRLRSTRLSSVFEFVWRTVLLLSSHVEDNFAPPEEERRLVEATLLRAARNAALLNESSEKIIHRIAWEQLDSERKQQEQDRFIEWAYQELARWPANLRK